MQTNPSWTDWTIFFVAALLLFAIVSPAHASEPVCFATTAEAAAQVGVRGVHGYWLTSSRRDPLSGAVWATVGSCEHPEWPKTVLLASVAEEASLLSPALRHGMASAAELTPPAAAQRVIVMQAGSRVTLLKLSATERMEVSGIVQTSAAVGDRVKVRLLSVSASSGPDDQSSWSEQRFAVGVVRSATLVEMESR